MSGISLNSTGKEVEPNSETGTVDQSESSLSVIDLSSSDDAVIDLSSSDDAVIDLSSSDDADDDHSKKSEADDREESDSFGEENRDQRKSISSSSPSHQLLATDVVKLVRGGDVKKLKVDDCRNYLRHYGLRVTGIKPVLIDRIKQHIEVLSMVVYLDLRKENQEDMTDQLSTSIAQVGFLATGCVQRRCGKVQPEGLQQVCQRCHTGEKQNCGRQGSEGELWCTTATTHFHGTLDIEVLWSTGYHPLPPMKQLLVKGRNLYRRKTFRQAWADEAERQRTLDEKHERGAVARQIRAVKQGRFKGHQGNAERYGREASSRQQLANPYIDTLAPKKTINCPKGNGFQSALSGYRFAAVRTRHHKTWDTIFCKAKFAEFHSAQAVCIRLIDKNFPENGGQFCALIPQFCCPQKTWDAIFCKAQFAKFESAQALLNHAIKKIFREDGGQFGTSSPKLCCRRQRRRTFPGN